MPAFGLLNIDKPGGITSRKVVDRVQRLVRPAKAGHAGTLDPLATGVLVVCLGAATRLIGYVQQLPKRYRGTFLLGRRSASDDVESEVVLLSDAPVPDLPQIRAAAASLTGTIRQRPPAFSAVKIGGRRAYRLAREGKPVEPPPREVQVYGIDVAGYDYPELTLDVHCGTGTYVRSLGRDLAAALGSAAVMSALVRTAVGGFTVDEAVPLEALSAETLPARLLPARRAVEHLPSVTVTAEERARLARGATIPRSDTGDHAEYAAVDDGGELVAIVRPKRRGLHPVRNFASR